MKDFENTLEFLLNKELKLSEHYVNKLEVLRDMEGKGRILDFHYMYSKRTKDKETQYFKLTGFSLV